MVSKFRGARKEVGGAGLEFALVFPVLFMTMYCGLVYGFVYFLQQRINFAVQEGLRAAISQDPSGLTSANYLASACTAAQTAVNQTFTAGGGTLPTAVSTTCPAPQSAGSFALQVNYNLTGLFPVISFPPPLNSFPILPAALTAKAEGRLS
jgi:Flp pilus assembly protein TadG